jgi:hypothetical protein
MPSAWNMFVKKIYEEGKSKDSNYKFKQALVDASKRKGEMGSNSSSFKAKKTAKKSRGRKASMTMTGGKKTRRRHRR